MQFGNRLVSSVYMIRSTIRSMISTFQSGLNIGCRRREKAVQSGQSGGIRQTGIPKGAIEGERGRIKDWIISGGSLKSSMTDRRKSPDLYPFLLSKDQARGVSTGVSWWAIGQLLMALILFSLWIRSIFASFDKASGSGIKPLYTATLSVEEVVSKMLTQTITPTEWQVLPPRMTPEPIKPTEVILPTSTPTPEPTEAPTATPTAWYQDLYIPPVAGSDLKPDRDPDQRMKAKLSYYYPPYAEIYGGAFEINCDKQNGSLECEQLSTGEFVKDHIGWVVACPDEFPIGTIFEIKDRFYTCKDRGGAIKFITKKSFWLDILYPYMPDGLYWGQEVYTNIWIP